MLGTIYSREALGILATISQRHRGHGQSLPLRIMKAELLAALGCSAETRVLDAGYDTRYVALSITQTDGFHVDGIDLTPNHITKAKQNIQHTRADGKMSVRAGDYHDLRTLQKDSFDGAYTMETLIRSTDPKKVLREFLRILKPGGQLVMYEYDHSRIVDIPRSIADEVRTIHSMVGMPSFEAFETDDLKKLALSVEYEDVELVDSSKHIVPMLWLFYVIALIPYLVLRLFGLQRHLVNTTSDVAMCKDRKYWRYM